MNRLAVGLTALALLALSAAQAHAGPTEVRYATISGTASSPATGKCTEPGYDDQCPSGDCMCVQVSGATVANVSSEPSLAGTGTANLYLTFDIGAEMPTGVGDCTPVFGIAELSTTRKKKSITETLNLVGVNCDALGTNPGPVLGGFGVSQKPTAPSPPDKGFGKVTGSLAGGALSLTLHGPAQ